MSAEFISEPTRYLSDEHRAYLSAHAIDPDLAAHLGVYSVIAEAALPSQFAYLGFDAVPALVYPYKPDWTGSAAWLQIRTDQLLLADDGSPMKYVFPAGESPSLWLVHAPSRPKGVAIIEGTKQALAVASTDPEWLVYAMAGCWNWIHDNTPVPELYELSEGLPLVVVLDADLRSNPRVWDAADRMLQTFPAVTGATSVKIATVPAGGTNGFDDVLARTPDAKRSKFVERVLAGAVDKLPARPGVVGRFFRFEGRRILFSPMTAASHLDDEAPFALHRAAGALYRYADPGVFRKVADVGPIAARLLGDRYEIHHKSALEGAIVALAHDRLLDEAGDSPLIPLTNGVLDPRTATLVEPSPDHLLLGTWGVAWEPEARCPRIMKYLADHFPGQVDAILDTMARVIDRVNPQDRVLFVFGPPRCGKSTLLRLLVALVGDAAASSEPLHKLSTDRWSAAQLFGKAVNVSADLSAEDVRDDSMFKNLTGGDKVAGELKFENKFTFTNHALLAFSANQIPALPAGSDAAFARFVPVAGGRTFVGKEDPEIEAGLMEELPGLLVELVRRHRARRKPVPLEVVSREFRRCGDRVAQYVEERLERLTDDEPQLAGARAADVYADYKIWVDRHHNTNPMGRNKFYDRLRALGLPVRPSDGNRVAARIAKVDRASGSQFRAWFDATFGPEGGPPDSRSDPEDLDPDGLDGSPQVTRTHETGGEREAIPYVVSDGTVQTVQGSVSVDFETASASEMATGNHSCAFLRVMAWTDATGEHSTTDPDEMRRVLLEAEHLITSGGWRFDLPAAAIHLGLDVESLIAKSDDTEALARLANPPRATKGTDRDRYGLGALARDLFGEDKADALPRLKRHHGGYDRIPTDDPEYLAYAQRDAQLTRRVAGAIAVPNSEYLSRERRVASLAASLTVRGVRVDMDLLKFRNDERQSAAMSAMRQLEDYGLPAAETARSQPWRTKAALPALDALAGQNGLRGSWPRGRDGLAITNREMLTHMATLGGSISEVARLILGITSAGSSFGHQVEKALSPTGRLHPQHKIVGTGDEEGGATGRWSTSDPNILGVGKRSEALKAERDIIVAEPDEVFISIDLAGIDARAVAGLSGDPNYITLMQPGVDIHMEIAEIFFGERTKAARDQIKPYTHGIPYGRSATTLAKDIVRRPGRFHGQRWEDAVPVMEEYLARYYARFPGIAEWQRRARAHCVDGGTIDNGFGRGIRTAPGCEHTQAPARQAQSCARDLAMEGLFRVQDAGLWPMARMFIHDELVLSVPQHRVAELGARVAELMSFDWMSPSGTTIPVIAQFDGSFGPRWSDAYEK